MIQQRPCPSCGRAETLDMGSGVNYCVQCSFHWSLPDAHSAGAAMIDFSYAERARLLTYRRAVQAGFYSEWV